MIVAFTGFKGSGKSTAARSAFAILSEDHDDPTCVKRSFAASLKETCARLFGLDKSQMYGDKKEGVDPRYGKTPREILQEVGSFFRDTYGTDFWIDCLDRQRRKGEITIIDDCRYPNEAEYVRAQGGIVIGIKGRVEIDDDHASETLMRDHWSEMVDYEIENTGDLQDLQSAIREILKSEGVV